MKKLYFEGDKEKEKLKIDIQTLKYLQKKQIPQSKAFLHSNNFTVFFSGMNQSKKNIGVMLDGFCLFAEKHRDSKLILVVHSKMKEIFGMKVVSDYDITDLYSWRKHLDQIKIVDRRMSDEELLDIYKISDVLLSASIGEGFGLFALEAMATETVPILTDYSAFIELPDEEAMFRIPVSAYQRSEWNVKRAIVSQENVANQLEKAYNVWKNNPERWHELQQKNLKKVKKYSWKDCATAIEKYLDDLAEGNEIVDSKVRRL